MPPFDPADPLSRTLDQAVAGQPAALQSLLLRGSRLPGTRMNTALADAFADACRSRTGRADAVALAMARLSADEAPGNTGGEFLPVCGVLALGARAAADAATRTPFVMELHAHADDLRFRVRDAVVEALSRVGAAAGDALVAEVAPWMDGFFHAAAVVRALGTEKWLGSLRDGEAVGARLDEAFALARDAQRAAARWPGHKALVEALTATPGVIAAGLGMPVLDRIERWAAVDDPALRDAVVGILGSSKLAARFGADVERIRRALDASLPPPRNPDHDFGPTRDRSGNRRRGGRSR